MNSLYTPGIGTPGAANAVDLNDSKEELGQGQAGLRTFRDLNIRSHDASNSNLAAVESAERVEALMAILTGQDARQSQEQMRVLRQLAGNPLQLQNSLAAQGGVTEQYLLLSGAITQGEREDAGNPAWEALRDARDRLWRTHGQAIRADVNTAESFGPGENGALDRRTYKDAVLGKPTLAGLLDGLINTYGNEGLEAAIGRFRSALGADLRALKPSVDHTRLQAILSELSQVSLVMPLLASCRALVERLGMEVRRPRAEASKQAEPQDRVAAQLLADLCPWLSKWVMQADVFDLLKRYKGQSSGRADDTEWKVQFLNGLSWLMRQIPSEAFPSLHHYTNIRDSVLTATDGFLQIDPPPASAQSTPGAAR